METRQAGFTLVELLVVLVILGLLAGLVGPKVFTNVDKAKVRTAQTQIKMLKGALQTLRLDIGRLPTTQEGLAILNTPPSDVACETAFIMLWRMASIPISQIKSILISISGCEMVKMISPSKLV